MADVCPTCGAVTEPSAAPPHPYIAASRGCWASFGRLQAQVAARWRGHGDLALVVDAYAAQHPGDGSDRRDRQSVFVHLAALEAVLAAGWPPERAVDLRRALLADAAEFPALPAPRGPAPLTHLALAGEDPAAIRAWGESVLAWAGDGRAVVRERLVALDLLRR